MKMLYIILLFTQLAPDARAEALSLEAFLSLVSQQNFDLQIEAAKVRSVNAAANGINLPPPSLGLTRLKETTTDSANGFEINQSIPFPTKLFGDYRAREHAASYQMQTRLGRENEILAHARLLYFLLWSNQERRSILLEKKNILLEHIRLLRASALSDSLAAIQLLKAESEVDLLENEIVSLEQTLRETQTTVAVYANADPTTFVSIAKEPSLSPLPIAEPPEDSHQLRSLSFMLENKRSKELEAQSAWLPDFSFRYKEMGPTSMAARYHEVTVGVTLPFIFFWEPYAASKQASAERNQAELELEKARINIRAEKVTLLTRAESLKKQLRILQEKLIPRAEKRMRIARNLAPRDPESIQDHREAMDAFPDLRMKALEIQEQYESTVASLEKYSSKRNANE